MPFPLVAALGGAMVAGGAAGSMFGKKKAKPIDISGQLAQVRENTAVGRRRTDMLYDDLQKPTADYQNNTESAIEAARTRNLANKDQFMGEQSGYIDQAKDALRKNLYSNTFSGLPDTLRAVRESSAAGGGLDTGSYQQALKETGIDTARQLVQGETGIQAQGMQGMQEASSQAYNTFSQLSSKLDDQGLDMIAKVMDTKRTDLVQRTAQQLGLDEQETQAILDLMNFQQSGEMARNMAADEQKQGFYNALIGGGASMMGKGMGGGASSSGSGGQTGTFQGSYSRYAQNNGMDPNQYRPTR